MVRGTLPSRRADDLARQQQLEMEIAVHRLDTDHHSRPDRDALQRPHVARQIRRQPGMRDVYPCFDDGDGLRRHAGVPRNALRCAGQG